MKDLNLRANKATACIIALENAAQEEYNKVFLWEKRIEGDDSVMIKLNMLANVGQLCRKILGNGITQINICCGVLTDVETKQARIPIQNIEPLPTEEPF